MKIYAVFIDEYRFGFKQTKLESVYTTKEGAENRVKKLEKSGAVDPYFISKPLKGDLVEAITKHYENKLKNAGQLSRNLTLKRVRGHEDNSSFKLHEEDQVVFQFEVTPIKIQRLAGE